MRRALFLLGLLWPLSAQAMPLPDCSGRVILPAAHVARVEKDGALVLTHGGTVVLEGVRLPAADDPSSKLAARALDALRKLAASGPLTLTAWPPEKDRYGRLRVQAFGTVWIQRTLLRQGLARVEIAPDRDECAPDFYEAEADARAAHLGLWALPQYRVRQGATLPTSLAGRFEVVEGTVVNASLHDGRAFLDFDADYRHGFSAIVQPEDRKAFRKMDFQFDDLVGHKVRLRGMVENFNGKPEIALSNPFQIEVLD